MDLKGRVLRNIISFFIGFAAVSCFGDGAVNDNVVEFAAMCRLLNVVKTGLEQADFASMVDKTWKDRLKKLTATYNSIEGVILNKDENVSTVGEANKEGTIVKIKELPAGTTEWAREEHFKVIKEDAESLIKDLTAEIQEQEKVEDQVKRQLKKALFGGEDLDKVTAGTSYHTTVGSACGGDGSGKAKGGPGSSIAGDIFCLCASSSGITKVCANGLGINVDGFRDSGLHSSWSKVTGECEKLQHQLPFSYASLRAAVHGVLSLVGRQSVANTQESHRFVLGKGNTGGTSPTCTSASYSCVNYAGAGGTTPTAMLEIDWAKAVTDAADQLERAQKRNKTIQEKFTELKSVVREAIALYGLNERIATMTPKGLQAGNLIAPTTGGASAPKPNSDLATKETMSNSKSSLVPVSLHKLLIIMSLA